MGCLVVFVSHSYDWYIDVERKLVGYVVKRVEQMERSQITRDRRRPRKTIRGVIKKDFEINDLDKSMVLDKTLW